MSCDPPPATIGTHHIPLIPSVCISWTDMASLDNGKYQYSSLDESTSSNCIRVFYLSPKPKDAGKDDADHITGRLTTQGISSSSCEALSYEWGSGGQGRYISINQSLLFVKENLWQALFHLRDDSSDHDPSQPRALWIDAICID
ncbi:hypothetical protein BKA65DRAFT_506758 [Rhexocercosporidium sp. MPI-PUGE-AT-0058]|nr:hypothetical protein BKA65DRAFT_506758 [Rhexocercosporidium sp. MPI-PUGE-AT-0058]